MRADGVCAGEPLRYEESVRFLPSRQAVRFEPQGEGCRACRIDVEDVPCGISRERSSLMKPLVLLAKGEPKGSLARFAVLANNHQRRLPLPQQYFYHSPNAVTVAKEGR